MDLSHDVGVCPFLQKETTFLTCFASPENETIHNRSPLTKKNLLFSDEFAPLGANSSPLRVDLH